MNKFNLIDIFLNQSKTTNVLIRKNAESKFLNLEEMNYINNLNQILLVNIKSNLITFHYKGINQKEFEKEIDKFILYLNKIKINFPLIKKMLII